MCVKLLSRVVIFLTPLLVRSSVYFLFSAVLFNGVCACCIGCRHVREEEKREYRTVKQRGDQVLLKPEFRPRDVSL